MMRFVLVTDASKALALEQAKLKITVNCIATSLIEIGNMHDGCSLEAQYIQSNNFVFGGINTSLIIKRWN